MRFTRRAFLVSTAPASLAGVAAVADPPAPGRAWLQRRGRIYWYDQYALNEQPAAFSKYDPDRITAELIATGADIIVIYAANQFSIAYYPSRIWPQHPNLHGRDYVGDLFSRLRPRGKKLVTYINWLESRHADWNTVPVGREADPNLAELPLVSWADPNDPEKRVQNVPGGRWRYPCINSPRREQVLAAAREIVDRYHPDAFHLDMFHANGAMCVCRYCRPTLQRICGAETITHAAILAHWREYIDWKMERSASLIRELTALLHEHGVLAVHNAATPFAPAAWGVGEDWMPHLDAYVSEAFSNLDVPSLTVRMHHALGKPTWELLTSTWPRYAHTSVPVAWWQVTAATCKANNGGVLGPCGVGAYPDTTSAKRLLANVKVGLDAHMRDADLQPGAVSLGKIAVVFSWATRKYFKAGAMNWYEEILGWSRLLIEEHLPFDFVVAEQVVTPASLARYQLVILPNSAHLSRTFCAALESYVRAGGRVVAVGETSLGDERGYLLSDFALGELFGVSRSGSVEGHFAISGAAGPEPVTGIFQQVKSSGETIAQQFAVDPAGSVSGSEDPLPTEPTEWPAAVAHTVGKGRTVYIAFDIGRFYATRNLEHVRELMVRFVRPLLPTPQVVLKAPRCVEVTVWKQSARQRTIIHLANRTQSATDLTRISQVVPVPGIEVSLPVPCANPRVTCRGTTVQSAIRGNQIIARLGDLEAYAALIIEPGASGGRGGRAG